MAGETLREATDLLGLYADNISGDISAVDGRDLIVSMVLSIGFVEDDPLDVPYVLPMTDAVPVPFLANYPGAALFAGNFWKLDGNGQIVPSYTDVGVTVPPGLERLNDGSVILNVQKIGGGTADYEFQGTEGGVFTGDPLVRTISATETILVFSGTRLYDVSVGGPIDFNITPLGHSDDLQVNDFRVALTGAML